MSELNSSTANKTLVIGASSSIAIELIKQLYEAQGSGEVIAVSRSKNAFFSQEQYSSVEWLQCDYSEGSIKEIVSQLAHHKGQISRIYICNGILHGTEIFPEKKLEELDMISFQQIMDVNTVIPALWLKHLKSLLVRKQDCVLTAFSARVGSIEDNRKGGWYTYRASKAALNMILKTASLEYRRISTGCRFLAFHPGTTDTPLSEPFQKSVPKGKLFTPEFVAKQLIAIVDALELEPTIQYLDWEGKSIPW